MLIDTEKEHGGPPVRKSECDSPVTGKSQFPLKATLSSISKAIDQWFRDLHMTPAVKGEFADSAMLKIAGRHGLGLFAIPVCIQDDVTAIYGLHEVGRAEGVKERFYAISAKRKLKHPAVIAIRENAF